jgi:flagellar biosynthesis/type III secretory pathway ATPase
MSQLATQGNMPAILALEAIMRTMPQVTSEPQHYHLDGDTLGHCLFRKVAR